jgi:FAD/FMN-containing dehydrogenase
MRSSSWGLLPSNKTASVEISRADFTKGTLPIAGNLLATGLGRSYGDVGLNPEGTCLSMTSLNRFVSFDDQTGVLECEPGVSIRDIQNTFAPRGWISPVTPGTSFVTVAGAIANDVHGKNHHTQGTFGNHVLAITILRTDGSSIMCSRHENEDYFRATIGGLGLTGIISRVRLQLARIPSPWVVTETLPFRDLDGFFRLSRDSENDFESSVAWFDCSTKKAGRGSFIRGNHVLSDKPFTEAKAPTLSFPFTPPFSLVNRLTLNLLNSSYFQLKQMTKAKKLESLWSFYYPLDGIGEWNRAYGPNGFFQYQSVIPESNAVEATKEMLRVISNSDLGSFLAVLKTFGKIKSEGLLSFPMEGVTLALDFPNRGEKTEALFKSLDSIVISAEGRLNPSKDARMSQDMFTQGYPNHRDFLKYRDPGVSSGFSKRVFGD